MRANIRGSVNGRNIIALSNIFYGTTTAFRTLKLGFSQALSRIEHRTQIILTVYFGKIHSKGS